MKNNINNIMELTFKKILKKNDEMLNKKIQQLREEFKGKLKDEEIIKMAIDINQKEFNELIIYNIQNNYKG